MHARSPGLLACLKLPKIKREVRLSTAPERGNERERGRRARGELGSTETQYAYYCKLLQALSPRGFEIGFLNVAYLKGIWGDFLPRRLPLDLTGGNRAWVDLGRPISA